MADLLQPCERSLALVAMIAKKHTWQIHDIGSVRGLRRRLVPGDKRGHGKPGLLPLASGREATNPKLKEESIMATARELMTEGA